MSRREQGTGVGSSPMAWASMLVLLTTACAPAPTLDLPDRPHDAPTGSEIGRMLHDLDRDARERRVFEEVARGNVPSWLREMRPVRAPHPEGSPDVTFWAAPDYLAVGSDTDYLRIPLTPQTAQRIADVTGTSLPTTRMVDAIWEAARVRLGPRPIPPNRLMTTVPVFEDHQRKVERQRVLARAESGSLVAGHKKDVVLTNELGDRPQSVAIYGWHYLDGRPIQRLYLGHTNDWVDYSHGIRLVDDTVRVGRERRGLAEALRDPRTAGALSDEGAMTLTRYPGVPNAAVGQADTLRVLAYNIHHGEGMDSVIDLERIAALIRSVDPDVVALQEIDSVVTRTNGVDQARELGRLTGMEPVFGRFMAYQGGAYGMALLSRWPIAETVNYRLPDGDEPRSALAAVVRSPVTGRAYRVVGIHFYRTDEERLAQARALDAHLVGDTLPTILAGDFNSTPGSSVMEYLAETWRTIDKGEDRLTFSSFDPVREIDFILVRPGERFDVSDERLLDEPVASDHRPVFVELVYPAPGG